MTLVFLLPCLGESAPNDTEDSGIIVQSDPKPRFPRSLWQRGIVTGQATVAIIVNRRGELEDWLVIEATHRHLIKPVEDVVPLWSFKAATIDGPPVRAAQRVSIFFDVSQLRNSHRQASVSPSPVTQPYAIPTPGRRGARGSRKSALKLADVSEVDRYPEVVTQSQPIVSARSLQQSLGSYVTFKFFIDTDGRVRMASLHRVQGNPDPQAIMAAHAALSAWRFKPMKAKGVPVVFEAAQTFEFSRLFAMQD